MCLHAAVHGSFCQLATFIWRIIFCAERLSWPIILYGRSILLFASACGKGLWVEHWLDRLLTLEPCPLCDCVVQHYRVPGQPRCRRENRKTLTLASVFFFFFFFSWFPPSLHPLSWMCTNNPSSSIFYPKAIPTDVEATRERLTCGGGRPDFPENWKCTCTVHMYLSIHMHKLPVAW